MEPGIEGVSGPRGYDVVSGLGFGGDKSLSGGGGKWKIGLSGGK